MIGDGFDEQKARNLVDILLKNDISIYRKLLSEVQHLNSEEFKYLFEGVDDYDYNVKNKRAFNKLTLKFNNFQVILEEWYKNPQYYEYLKELWTRYPCIENLRDKEEKELEDALKSYSINYVNWPSNVKTEFKTLVSSTQDTRVFELKNIIENNFSELHCVLEELIVLREAMKDQGDEGLIYKKNSHGLLINLINTVAIPFASYFGYQNIKKKELETAYKIISGKGYNKHFAEKFIKILKEKKLTGCYNYRDKFKKLHRFRFKCKNGNLNNLDLMGKAQAFFKSQMVCGIHAALSFLNLGWSVYELNKTYKGFKEVKYYKIRLQEIVSLFEIHKKEIGILPEDFQEAAQKIKNVMGKIRNDQENLRQLMTDIRNSIKKQESQKNKSIVGLIASGVLGVFGVAGSIITFNGVSLVYGISSCVNLISAITHTTNIVMATKIIDGFKDVLEKAIEEEKKIQKEIDTLIKELYERLELEPKFELNSSISSISTNFDEK